MHGGRLSMVRVVTGAGCLWWQVVTHGGLSPGRIVSGWIVSVVAKYWWQVITRGGLTPGQVVSGQIVSVRLSLGQVVSGLHVPPPRRHVPPPNLLVSSKI